MILSSAQPSHTITYLKSISLPTRLLYARAIQRQSKPITSSAPKLDIDLVKSVPGDECRLHQPIAEFPRRAAEHIAQGPSSWEEPVHMVSAGPAAQYTLEEGKSAGTARPVVDTEEQQVLLCILLLFQCWQYQRPFEQISQEVLKRRLVTSVTSSCRPRLYLNKAAGGTGSVSPAGRVAVCNGFTKAV